MQNGHLFIYIYIFLGVRQIDVTYLLEVGIRIVRVGLLGKASELRSVHIYFTITNS